MKSVYLLFTLILIFNFTSCNRMNPANFWDDFDSNNKVSSEGDFQGRYGYKIVNFKRKNGTYKIPEIISFAKKNEWNLYNSTNYKTEELVQWKENGKLFFKPSITGFEPNEIAAEFIKIFPRYIDNDFTVYEFDTDGMVLVNSETDDTTQRTGFILLNKGKTMMTVYHLWGETNRH